MNSHKIQLVACGGFEFHGDVLNGNDFGIEIDDKKFYRFSTDRDGKLHISLINDAAPHKITTEDGYPTIVIG